MFPDAKPAPRRRKRKPKVREVVAPVDVTSSAATGVEAVADLAGSDLGELAARQTSAPTVVDEQIAADAVAIDADERSAADADMGVPVETSGEATTEASAMMSTEAAIVAESPIDPLSELTNEPLSDRSDEPPSEQLSHHASEPLSEQPSEQPNEPGFEPEPEHAIDEAIENAGGPSTDPATEVVAESDASTSAIEDRSPEDDAAIDAAAIEAIDTSAEFRAVLPEVEDTAHAAIDALNESSETAPDTSNADDLAAFDALVQDSADWAPNEDRIDTSGVMEIALEGGPNAFESIVDDADVMGQVLEDPHDESDAPTGAARHASRAAIEAHPERVTSEELDELMLQSESAAGESTIDYEKLSDEITRLSASFDSMRESALEQIRESLAANAAGAREPDLQRQVEKILNEFAAVREEMLVTSRATQRSLDAAESARDRVRDLHDRLSAVNSSLPRLAASPAPRRVAGGADAAAGLDRPVVLIAVAVILLSWAVMFYVRTGDMRTAIAGLVLANLAGCGMLIHSKSGKFF